MEQKIMNKKQSSASKKPEINKSRANVKAAHLSSNPINDKANNGTAHFEVEVENAFFRVFNL